MDEKPIDCLVIGAGPAGLTAAIYLARFHLNLLVVDGGKSRAAMIPCTRNHAGFPRGISGQELIGLMKEQAQKYGARIVEDFVTRLDKEDDLFRATWGSGSVQAR
jgi:thioredoxin reductase (NADPH)